MQGTQLATTEEEKDVGIPDSIGKASASSFSPVPVSVNSVAAPLLPFMPFFSDLFSP
jgi:hypothetical protein